MNCCAISNTRLSLVLISCLSAIAISAPIQSRGSNERGSPRWDHFETILRKFLDSLELSDERTTNMSLELNGTFFEDVVCPHMDTYNRLQLALPNNMTNEEDEKHEYMTILTFITQRQTEALCNMVRQDCLEKGLECGNMDCNINSIAMNCLLVEDPLSRSLRQSWGSHLQKNAKLSTSLQHWLGEILRDEVIDESTWTTISRVLRDTLCMTCTRDESDLSTFSCRVECDK